MSRSILAAGKLFAGPLLDVVVGWVWMLTHYLVKGIMRIDLWHAFTVYSTMGAISGFLVGVFWGVSALVTPPAAPPDSN